MDYEKIAEEIAEEIARMVDDTRNRPPGKYVCVTGALIIENRFRREIQTALEQLHDEIITSINNCAFSKLRGGISTAAPD